MAARHEQNSFNDHVVAEAIAYFPLKVSQILLASGFSANSFLCVLYRERESAIGRLLPKRRGRESALHAAIQLDSLAKVKLLLSNAADPKVT